MPTCPHCAEPVEESARMCKFCGEWLTEAPPQPEKEPIALAFLVLVGVIALVIIAAIVAYQTG